MKNVVILLVLLPRLVYSQDCNLKTTKDIYTKEVKITTGLIALNTGQYSIEASKSGIDIMFSIGESCYDDNSSAAVYYAGTRLKTNFRNGGAMNCNGIFHFAFRNTNPTQTNLQNLGSKKISAIRFKDNTNKEIGVSLTDDQQQTFMNLINCIITQSKTLLQ